MKFEEFSTGDWIVRACIPDLIYIKIEDNGKTDMLFFPNMRTANYMPMAIDYSKKIESLKKYNDFQFYTGFLNCEAINSNFDRKRWAMKIYKVNDFKRANVDYVLNTGKENIIIWSKDKQIGTRNILIGDKTTIEIADDALVYPEVDI